MFSGNTSKFGELSTTTDISKVRLVTIPNKDIKVSPTPDFTPDNSQLVGVTSENKGILVPASELLPGVAFNSVDRDPKPMVSGVVWNEQEQLREAFTEGPSFTLPHFRYVADDYFWKSIVGDKAFYYLPSMKLNTWPLDWHSGSTFQALHLDWLRAPEQTQIFKFTDATPNSTWSAPATYGNIILQNRTDEMVKADPMDVRVNECSTSTKLKEVRVVVDEKDKSPLYINFPGADVNLTIRQYYGSNYGPVLSNIKLTSDSISNIQWRTFTINTLAGHMEKCFNIEGDGQFCTGTVWVNAPNVSGLYSDYNTEGVAENNSFRGNYTPGAGVPDVRVALPKLNQSLIFFENFPLKKETVLYLLKNLNPSPSNTSILTVGIDTELGATESDGMWILLDADIQSEVSRLEASGKWTISWKPISVEGGGVEVGYKVYDYLLSSLSARTYGSSSFALSYGTLPLYSGATIEIRATLNANKVLKRIDNNYPLSCSNYIQFCDTTGADTELSQHIVTIWGRNDDGSSRTAFITTDTSKAKIYKIDYTTYRFYCDKEWCSLPGVKLNPQSRQCGLRMQSLHSRSTQVAVYYLKVKTSPDATDYFADMIPCKRVSDAMPGLYDKARINPATGTHFWPATNKLDFTCHYENEQS